MRSVVDSSPQWITARRTESLDAPVIASLATPHTDLTFGRVDVVDLIERAALSITVVNESDEILAQASFVDYPNVKDVNQVSWLDWFEEQYIVQGANEINTLFLHLFVSKADYSHGAAREVIYTAFNTLPHLDYIFLATPPGVFPESALADIFKDIKRKQVKIDPGKGVLFGAYRHDHLRNLHCRQAIVEDHDDLEPLLTRLNETLQLTYGSYYLAELIEAQNDDMKCFVVENEGFACGFASVTTDIDLDQLNKCFELKPFHGLHKPHPDDDNLRIVESVPSSVLRGDYEEAEKDVDDASIRSTPDEHKETELLDKSKTDVVKMTPSAAAHQVHGFDVIEYQEIASYDSQSRSETRSSLQTESPPKKDVPAPDYYGESNAVMIQLFCIDEKLESRSIDFLPTIFETFPDRDMCIISVPHLVPEFPLIQNFTRVTPRHSSILHQELYVFHKAGLIPNFSVRATADEDREEIETQLISSLAEKESIQKHLDLYLQMKRLNDGVGTELKAYCAVADGKIAGLAILSLEDDIEYIRSHYNIEDFIYFNHHRRNEHGCLHHFIINPIFNYLTRYFFKEVLRISQKTCLYYRLYPPYVDMQLMSPQSLTPALKCLVPIRPRRQIVYAMDTLQHNAPSERVLKEDLPYALYHTNRKLVLEPKTAINARIVLVGASDTAVAYLETFVFNPHLLFNNLTVISPHGLPGNLVPDELRDTMLASNNCYTIGKHSKISLRSWVNEIFGKVTAIDRKRKTLTVNMIDKVPYDHVVLTTGMQYQLPPVNMLEEKSSDVIRRGLTVDSALPANVTSPVLNVFAINDAHDAQIALKWLENQVLGGGIEGELVVYGNTLDAFACLQTLIRFLRLNHVERKIEKIVFVQPPELVEGQPSCFNNRKVEATILEAVTQAGIRMYSSYKLTCLAPHETEAKIEWAKFTSSEHEMLKLQIGAMFCFDRFGVDHLIFNAINEACLVFYGRLVIDGYYHTNDILVRAGGPLTKFKRKYYADEWRHELFNPVEVGQQFAELMLRIFDPVLGPVVEPPQEGLNLIPLYHFSKSQSCELPGDFYYLHVWKPGVVQRLEIQTKTHGYGKVCVTGTLGGTPEYFRLHLNQYDAVETITCLSKTPLPISNYLALFGLNERFMNDFLKRHDADLIDDLYEFFNEPWANAIFHDRFQDLREEVREIMVTDHHPDKSFDAMVRQRVEEDVTLTREQKKAMLMKFIRAPERGELQTRVLSFLNYNSYHLPMYYRPGQLF